MKNSLICDADIGSLNNQKNLISEQDLLEVLRRYNLKDGLACIWQLSKKIDACDNENFIHSTAFRDPETGLFITQFFLAYLVNMLIISGSNDYKAKTIRDKDNLLTLCNIYYNTLVTPLLLKEPHEITLAELLISLYFEQLDHQHDYVTCISRAIVLYDDIANNAKGEGSVGNLNDIFKKQTGLTIHEYLVLAIGVWAGSHSKVFFNQKYLINSTIPHLSEIFSKAGLFFKILSASYEDFRNLDNVMNVNLDPNNTKNRFNPLYVYPILKITKVDNGDDLIIPCSAAYIEKSFQGLFWWFNNYYESKGDARRFREYFGKNIFEIYVKRILETIYGEGNVNKLFLRNNDEFFDWYVIKEERVYLFETKAYQFNLRNRMQIEQENLINTEVKKIASAIKQVNNNLKKINQSKELNFLIGKKIIPIIVFLDMPFITSPGYDLMLKKNGIDNDSNVRMMNIEDLEAYEKAAGYIELDDLLDEVREKRSNTFEIMKSYGVSNFRNSLLDEAFKKFEDILKA